MKSTKVKITKVGERYGMPVYEAGEFVLVRHEYTLPSTSFVYEVWCNFKHVGTVDRLGEFREALSDPEVVISGPHHRGVFTLADIRAAVTK